MLEMKDSAGSCIAVLAAQQCRDLFLYVLSFSFICLFISCSLGCASLLFVQVPLRSVVFVHLLVRFVFAPVRFVVVCAGIKV